MEHPGTEASAPARAEGVVTPDFIIAGAMRSGTTSLHHWLRHHPQVFIPEVKEVHYFDLHYERGPGWYSQHFQPAAGRRTGEATPEYLFLPWARQRLTTDLPDAKLVVSLRDPVERAWSHYCMLRARGREDLSFEAALDAESDRLAVDRSVWSRYGYTAKGRYAEQLEDLFALQGRENVLVLIFERDVVADPHGSYRRLCEFIGVDQDAHGEVVGSTVNAAVTLRSVRLRDAARRLPKPAQNLVGRWNARPQSNEPMDGRVRSRLEQEFAGPNARLEQLLGQELTEWRSGSSMEG